MGQNLLVKGTCTGDRNFADVEIEGSDYEPSPLFVLLPPHYLPLSTPDEFPDVQR